ncbi:MFS transporter [Dictyobacter arantiisoli]|uniref:Major facilitator superfamily (MFS) profile domain-containing protein n=1 Tax=Dictyobacter arantiisoli TaxID=2014874 RepID=A0A5A5TBB4_9CHLR|nr:MFS transporter [Dictyobacter arantiisoli]GCF08780.1 hypothetical protein KDI_23440 [Dictyobacter arantiisoli]
MKPNAIDKHIQSKPAIALTSQNDRFEGSLAGPVPVLPSHAHYVSVGASIFSSLLLRVASRISFVLLGFYLGEHFTSAGVVALVLESFYLSELLLAPLSGSISDRIGRKPFLLGAPMLGALAALCLLLSTWIYPHPDARYFSIQLFFLLCLILCGRLLEGATTALNTPASLGYITDSTYGLPGLRTKVMTAFEVATVGGLALAIPFGGQVSVLLGNWGFLVVMALHLCNVLVVAFFVKERQFRTWRAKNTPSLMSSFFLLRDRHIAIFLPAWLSVNTLVGAWITLIVITLTYPNPAADLRHPHQLLYGGFGKSSATLIFGGFGLLFLLGMGLWLLVIPHLRRTTVMLIGLAGLALCIAALTAINGLAENVSSLTQETSVWLWLLLPLVMIGVLLLSGFTPVSLTQMASISERKPDMNGSAMGLYSVVMGIGQLVGASIGGFSIDLGGFYGLMAFSAILGVCSLVSVFYMRAYRHDTIQA